ncbi:hypothetical protein ACF0H5_007388 [Mactra antiquata]
MTGLLFCLPLQSPWLQADDSSLNDGLKHLDKDKSPLVFVGDEDCGKTVFLFQAAIAFASKDYHVTCISRCPLTRMPLSIHGMTRPESAGQLKTLTFMYMNKVSDLIDYYAKLHTKSLLPDVIIIDDFDYYIDQMQEPTPEAGCAKLCAIIQDTANFIQSKSCVGCVMLGCRNRQKYVPQILRQYKYSLSNITASNPADKIYDLCYKGRQLTLNVNYQIKSSGLFIKDVSMTSRKTS